MRDAEVRFATLDVMVVDLDQHEGQLLKVAAAPTFLVRGGRVEVIRGESLPVGILDSVQVTPLCRKLEAGDVVVMVSDGALLVPDGSGEDRLAGYLTTVAMERPDVMAETLLALMLDLDEGRTARDDALVMVIRVSGTPVAAPERVGGQILGEWRRITSRRAAGDR